MPDVICRMPTTLGELVLVGDGRQLSGLYFADGRCPPLAGVARDDGLYPRARAQLTEYVAGERSTFDLELDLSSGSPFQQRVWQALLEIPYGSTRTYGALARELGTSARAAGLANGRNPLSIVVPCHRLVGASGALTGYGGGLDRKRFLLELEHERANSRQIVARAITCATL